MLDGRQSREQALARYHAFSAGHARPFAWMLRVQRLVPRVAPRLLAPALRAMGAKRFVDWSFGHYLNIAHPEFVAAAARAGRPLRRRSRPSARVRAAYRSCPARSPCRQRDVAPERQRRRVRP